MKKAKELLRRLEAVFPLKKGRGRHSLIYMTEKETFILGLRLGSETFPFILDEEGLKVTTTYLINEIQDILNEKAVCKNCGKNIRSLEGAPEIPIHSVSENRICYNSKGLATWGMPK